MVKLPGGTFGFRQLWLSIELHERNSINAPPYSEVWLLSWDTIEGSGFYSHSPAIYHWVTPPFKLILDIKPAITKGIFSPHSEINKSRSRHIWRPIYFRLDSGLSIHTHIDGTAFCCKERALQHVITDHNRQNLFNSLISLFFLGIQVSKHQDISSYFGYAGMMRYSAKIGFLMSCHCYG